MRLALSLIFHRSLRLSINYCLRAEGEKGSFSIPHGSFFPLRCTGENRLVANVDQPFWHRLMLYHIFVIL